MFEKKSANEYLKRLKNGENCLEEFFYDITGALSFVAYKHLIDKSFVNDVVMNTFCIILDNIQKFDEQKNGKAWIYKIAQHEAYKINDRERKEECLSIDNISEEIACVSEDETPFEFLIDLERAIDKLEDVDKQIVEMRLLQDMRYAEIAKKLDMYIGSVYKRYKKSVKIIGKDIF